MNAKVGNLSRREARTVRSDRSTPPGRRDQNAGQVSRKEIRMSQNVVDHTRPERGEPAVRTLAMPADTNPSGDIFGGWVLAQMDLAAGIVASQRAKGRVATAALDAMSFHKPVYVGDLVSCYAKVIRIGRSSLTVQVDTFVLRRREGAEVKVTEGSFTLVAIDEHGRPRPVPPETG
jgi:acyl-CoA thioesterase YciA